MTLLSLTPAVATHRGMHRRKNEDAVGYNYPKNIRLLQSHGALFIVADGVGGLSAGDKASRLAVDQLIKHYYRSDVSQGIEKALIKAVKQVNIDVLVDFNRKGATTLVAIVIHGEQLFTVSVGDSQIFSVISDTITQLNEEDVVRSNDADNGALTKAVGYRDELDVIVNQHNLVPKQKILLCSDGLTRYLDHQALIQLINMRDPRDAVRRMINTANTAGGADNVSALLVHIGEEMQADDLDKHITGISVPVSVDTDPLMRPDIPEKPQTQIPLSRPETRFEDVLEHKAPSSEVEEAPQIEQPDTDTNTGSTTLIIIVAVVILLIGAIIFGFALSSLNSPTEVATPEPTQEINDSSNTSVIQVGDVILVDDVILTKNNIGSDVGSFLTSPNTAYFIETITADSTGQLWYLLLEEETQQTGWLAQSNLQAYTVQND